MQESTSHENDLFSRQRHQSGPQEPQSTTPSTSVLPPGFPPHPQEHRPASTSAVTSANSEGGKKTDMIGDKALSSILECLWEKGDADPLQKPNRKRKASGADGSVDSTDMELGMPSQQQVKMANNFRNKNVLLAQLLSKRTPNEAVVNTGRLLVNSDPCETPQHRLSVHDKPLSMRPIDSKRLSTEKEKENLKDGIQGFQNSNQYGNMDTSMKTSIGNFSCASNINTSASTSVFNGISISTSNSNVSSMSGEYDELQKILGMGSNTVNSEPMTNSTSGMDVEPSGTPDPLLAEILKQAADLEQEHILQTSNSMPNLGPDMSCIPQGGGADLNPVPSSEDLQLLTQLEQVIQDPNFNIGSIPGLEQEPHQSDDRAAIRRIQNALMSEDPFPAVSSMGQMNNMGPNLSSQAAIPQQNSFGMVNNQQHPLSSPMGSGGMDMQYQHMAKQQSPLPTQTGSRFPQGAPKFLPQGPRHSNPQGKWRVF